MKNTLGGLPCKVQGVYAREAGGDVVVVDANTKQAHVLRGVAADVWRGIDAGRWPSAGPDRIRLALVQLEELGLIERSGLTRRQALRGAGTVAVAGTVLTIGLPTPAMAASASTSTTLSSSVASPTPGSNFTLKATVAPAGATSGTVTLVNQTTGLAVGSPLAPGAASSTGWSVTASATSTSETFVATYSGTAGYQPSQGSITLYYTGAFAWQATGPMTSVAGSTATVASVSMTVSYPSGTANHDLLVLVLVNNAGNQTAPPIGGWTLIQGSTTTDGTKLSVYWRSAQASNPASLSFNVPTNNLGATAWMARWSRSTSPASGGTARSGSAAAATSMKPSTDFTTNATNATVISIVAIPTGAQTPSFSLQSGSPFTLRFQSDPTTGYASGSSVVHNAIGMADTFAASNSTTPASPTWVESGTAVTWSWVTFGVK